MIDDKLVQQYASAVQARRLIQRLPEGVREYALQFESICLEDIRAQAGNPNLTEEEIIKKAKPTIWKIVVDVWPLLSPVLLALLKKYLPTIAASGTIGAAIASYLTK